MRSPLRLVFVVVLMLAVIGVMAAKRLHDGVTITAAEKERLSCRIGDLQQCLRRADALVQSGQDPEALPLYETACDRGQAEGCAAWGRLLVVGKGIPPDLEKARALLEDACEVNGSAYGCWIYGDFLAEGTNGFPKDVSAGIAALEKSCADRYANGCVRAAHHEFLRSRNSPAIVRSAARGCALGSSEGCLLEADARACGFGVPEDRDAAMRIYVAQCEAGVDRGCSGVVRWMDDPARRAMVMPKGTLRDAWISSVVFATQEGTLDPAVLDELRPFAPEAVAFAEAGRAIDARDYESAGRKIGDVALALPNGAPEIEMMRAALEARRSGASVSTALVRRWKALGSPDLRTSKVLAHGKFDFSTLCHEGDPREAERAPSLLAALKDVSHWTAPTRRLAERAAQVDLGAPVSERLAALSIIDMYSERHGDRPLKGAARAIADSLSDGDARANLYFVVLKVMGGHEKTEPLTDGELALLEEAVSRRAPYAPPRERVQREAAAELRKTEDPPASAVVTLTVAAIDAGRIFSLGPRVEARATVHPEERARLGMILVYLGEQLSRAPWLIERMIAVSTFRSAARLTEDDALTKRADEMAERYRALILAVRPESRFGGWPLRTMTEEATAALPHETEFYEQWVQPGDAQRPD